MSSAELRSGSDSATGGLEALAAQVGRGGVFVLTGAGLSTDSGIPDYRGRDGLRRVMPMSFGEFMGSRGARQRYWARSYVGWQRFRAAVPNSGHRRVADLQQWGLVDYLVTQNVDGLHQQAGSEQVEELHGSLAEVMCVTCGDRTARAHVQERLMLANPGFLGAVLDTLPGGSQVSSQIRPDGDIVVPDDAIGVFHPPRCLVCGADTLKPDVVFFGESVPKDRVERCFAAVERSCSVLVLGSSLAVMSGYRFVRRAAASGIPVAVLTRGVTRAEAEATLRVDAALGPTLDALVAALR
ncbi:MAG: NAD-dependent protein deacetylase [Candidatus Phosphoribacter sp.]